MAGAHARDSQPTDPRAGFSAWTKREVREMLRESCKPPQARPLSPRPPKTRRALLARHPERQIAEAETRLARHLARRSCESRVAVVGGVVAGSLQGARESLGFTRTEIAGRFAGVSDAGRLGTSRGVAAIERDGNPRLGEVVALAWLYGRPVSEFVAVPGCVRALVFQELGLDPDAPDSELGGVASPQLKDRAK